jgi:hypothetical protein
MRYGPGNLKPPLCGVSGASLDRLARVSETRESLRGQIVRDEPTDPAVSRDLFVSPFRARQADGWRGDRRVRVRAPLVDFYLAFSSGYSALVGRVGQMPVRRAYVATVLVPAHRDGLEQLLQTPKGTRQTVTVLLVPLSNRDRLKCMNLARRDIHVDEVDCLIVIDDEVAIPRHWLDRVLYTSEAASLGIAQPAHAIAFAPNVRKHTVSVELLVPTRSSMSRGPVTAFRQDIFPQMLPFPETRFAWGIDVICAEMARRANAHIGAVDATPTGHLRPVAQSYDANTAKPEARQLTARFGARRSWRQNLETPAVMTRL